MRGMSGAQKALRALLEAQVPAKVLDIEDRHGWGPGTLEAVRLFGIRTRAQLDGDAWPAVIVDGRDTISIERVDTMDGGPIYRVVYRVRVMAFTRGETEEDTAARRDDLVLAVREVLLGNVDNVADDGTPLRVDDRSLVESYSDVLPDELGRSIAAGYVEAQVIMEEAAPVDTIGEVATVLLNPAMIDD